MHGPEHTQSKKEYTLTSPALTPVAGHPIGNGRMGTMVWTTLDTIELQINRMDVFAANRHTSGRRFDAADPHTDYCGACGRVSIRVSGAPFAPGPAFAQRTMALAPRHRRVLNGEALNTAIRSPIATARAELGEQLPVLLQRYREAFSPLPNGFSLFEQVTPGYQAHSIEHLGLITMTLQEALLQSVSPRPGEPEIISVFPAWPREWDADFRLLARGGFLVQARFAAGAVEWVTVHSRRGETCRLRNPWGHPCTVAAPPESPVKLEDEVLTFETRAGVTYSLSPGA